MVNILVQAVTSRWPFVLLDRSFGTASVSLGDAACMGLKIRCPKGRAGSPPPLGITRISLFSRDSINLVPGNDLNPKSEDGAKDGDTFTDQARGSRGSSNYRNLEGLKCTS
jgi:hypothetical protein